MKQSIDYLVERYQAESSFRAKVDEFLQQSEAGRLAFILAPQVLTARLVPYLEHEALASVTHLLQQIINNESVELTLNPQVVLRDEKLDAIIDAGLKIKAEETELDPSLASIIDQGLKIRAEEAQYATAVKLDSHLAAIIERGLEIEPDSGLETLELDARLLAMIDQALEKNPTIEDPEEMLMSGMEAFFRDKPPEVKVAYVRELMDNPAMKAAITGYRENQDKEALMEARLQMRDRQVIALGIGALFPETSLGAKEDYLIELFDNPEMEAAIASYRKNKEALIEVRQKILDKLVVELGIKALFPERAKYADDLFLHNETKNAVAQYRKEKAPEALTKALAAFRTQEYDNRHLVTVGMRELFPEAGSIAGRRERSAYISRLFESIEMESAIISYQATKNSATLKAALLQERKKQHLAACIKSFCQAVEGEEGEPLGVNYYKAAGELIAGSKSAGLLTEERAKQAVKDVLMQAAAKDYCYQLPEKMAEDGLLRQRVIFEVGKSLGVFEPKAE